MNKKFLKKWKSAKIGILTNQSAFSIGGKYHFELFKELLDLKVIFIPEHGLFAELQDQVSGSHLKYEYEGLEAVNLYGDSEDSLITNENTLSSLDLVIFDIRDVGARYYTFLTSCFYLMNSIYQLNKKNGKVIPILIIDSPNPIGKKLEGSPLLKKYSSFVGVETVLHRHGLSPAELMNYYNDEFQFNLQIEVIRNEIFYGKKENPFFWVPPSPNIPAITTCHVYAGQCLLEGTNLSEGRGTTRPFEIFGAPFINIQNKSLIAKLMEFQPDSFILRPLIFQPTFHKYKDSLCGGFQIIIKDIKKFHSLLFSLHMIRTIREFYPEQFEFKKGVYEFRSDKSAIELLAGDEFILDYLNGNHNYLKLKSYFENEEDKWRNKTKKYHQ